MAKTPRKYSKTKDITGGLPRVAELFKARGPKDASEISKIDGVVDFGPSVRGKRTILIEDPGPGVEEEHLIPIGKHVIVFKGDYVKKGQQLTEGPVDPQEILDMCGPRNAGAPLQRSTGSLSPPGRDHQRQAHRNHRAPNAPQGPRQQAGRHFARGLRQATRGMQYQIHPVEMDFAYEEAFQKHCRRPMSGSCWTCSGEIPRCSCGTTNWKPLGSSSRRFSKPGNSRRTSRNPIPRKLGAGRGRRNAPPFRGQMAPSQRGCLITGLRWLEAGDVANHIMPQSNRDR